MRRKRASRLQVTLFPAVVKGEWVAREAKGELVQAVADLLIEALKVDRDAEGGLDDEHEDHG